MQLEILLKRLEAFAPYVTDEVIQEFKNKCYMHPTKNEIKEYLNGKGIDGDIAYDLYHFLKEKISLN